MTRIIWIKRRNFAIRSFHQLPVDTEKSGKTTKSSVNWVKRGKYLTKQISTGTKSLHRLVPDLVLLQMYRCWPIFVQWKMSNLKIKTDVKGFIENTSFISNWNSWCSAPEYYFRHPTSLWHTPKVRFNVYYFFQRNRKHS